MDRARLLSHFDTLADTPDAVAKLRELILSLAIQGRLVPQHPKDEPADSLLAKIDAERARRVAGKKLEASPRMKASVLPKDTLPSGWCWAPFGRVSFCRDGERIPVNSDERENLAKTYDYYGASGVIDKIDRYLFDEPLLLIGEDGANLVNRSTPIAFIAEGEYWVNNHAHVLDAIDRTLLEYLRLYINAIDLKPYLTGMAQPKMNQAQMNSIPVPLPPLAEQKRIVARVEELLALCDELEARQTAAREQRTRLVQSAFDHLTAARDDSEFRKHAAFCLQHSDLLFDSVPALRQAILALAVQGRLVPQSPKDEPATALLAKIQQARIAYAKKEGIKAPAEFAAPDESELPFPVPHSWARTRLGNLTTGITSGYSPQCESHPRADGEWGVLKISAVSWDHFDPNENKALPAHIEARADFEVQDGDFLMSRANTAELVAKSVIAVSPPPRLLLCDKILRVGLTSYTDKQFINILNNSLVSRAYYAVAASGTSSSMKNIAREGVAMLPIALPPLAEQQRIVAKVASLMRWCDELETRLAAAQHAAAALLDSSLHALLAD